MIYIQPQQIWTFSDKCDKCQTLHDGSVHCAFPVQWHFSILPLQLTWSVLLQKADKHGNPSHCKWCLVLQKADILTGIVFHVFATDGQVFSCRKLTGMAFCVPTADVECYVAESWQAWHSMSLQLMLSVMLQKADRHGILCPYNWCWMFCCRKLTGMAFRVPTADVSVVDLTVKLKNPVSSSVFDLHEKCVCYYHC